MKSLSEMIEELNGEITGSKRALSSIATCPGSLHFRAAERMNLAITGVLERITAAVKTLTETSFDVDASSKEISAGTSSVVLSMDHVEGISNESAARYRAITDRVESISTSLGSLFRLSSRNSENYGDLLGFLGGLELGRTVVSDYLPPFTYIEGSRPTGVVIDIVRALFESVGRPFVLDLLNWGEAYRLALDTPDVPILSILRNAERESLFKWVGPIFVEKTHFFGLASRTDLSVKSIDDLRKYTIGCVQDNFDYEFLTKRGIPGERFVLVRDHSANIENLFAGRVDVINLSALQSVYQFKEMQKDISMIRQLYTLDEISSDLYVGFGAQSDDALVKAFADALERFKTTPQYRDLLKKYGTAPA